MLRIPAVLSWMAVVTVALALQSPEPGLIPPYPGDDDPTHNGQPMFCQREDSRRFKANCMKCENTCENGDEVETSSCQTYCRKGACLCHPPCQT